MGIVQLVQVYMPAALMLLTAGCVLVCVVLLVCHTESGRRALLLGSMSLCQFMQMRVHMCWVWLLQ